MSQLIVADFSTVVMARRFLASESTEHVRRFRRKQAAVGCHHISAAPKADALGLAGSQRHARRDNCGFEAEMWRTSSRWTKEAEASPSKFWFWRHADDSIRPEADITERSLSGCGINGSLQTLRNVLCIKNENANEIDSESITDGSVESAPSRARR